jgi:hypothetical protein
MKQEPSDAPDKKKAKKIVSSNFLKKNCPKATPRTRPPEDAGQFHGENFAPVAMGQH